MATLSKVHRASYTEKTGSETALVTRFINWCESYENYRYLVLITIIMIQGNLMIPATFFAMLKFETVFTGMSVYLTGVSTLAVLVTNLAQVPMKVVIPTFILNLVALFTIIFIHLAW